MLVMMSLYQLCNIFTDIIQMTVIEILTIIFYNV